MDTKARTLSHRVIAGDRVAERVTRLTLPSVHNSSAAGILSYRTRQRYEAYYSLHGLTALVVDRCLRHALQIIVHALQIPAAYLRPASPCPTNGVASHNTVWPFVSLSRAVTACNPNLDWMTNCRCHFVSNRVVGSACKYIRQSQSAGDLTGTN